MLDLTVKVCAANKMDLAKPKHVWESTTIAVSQGSVQGGPPMAVSVTASVATMMARTPQTTAKVQIPSVPLVITLAARYRMWES